MKHLALATWLLAIGCGRIGFDAESDGGPRVDAEPVPVNTSACPSLPVAGTTMQISTAQQLRDAAQSAPAGTTLLLDDGVYTITDVLRVTQSVTIRSASGNASGVIIDGTNVAVPVIRITASDAKLISLTVANGADDGIVIEAPPTNDIAGVQVYDVTVVDVANSSIRIRPNASQAAGPFADGGTVACSRVTTTGTTCDAAQAGWGIDVNGAQGWTVRHNLLDRRLCTTPTARTLVVDTGSRDIVLEGNVLLGTTFGIMLGGMAAGRAYPTDPLPSACSGAPDVVRATICNNVISSPSPPSRGVDEDFQEGLALWNVCDAWVMHNTIVSPALPEVFSNLEYRYADTYVHLVNNLTRVAPLEREGAVADPQFTTGNTVYPSPSIFRNPGIGDLHLVAGTDVGTGDPIDTILRCGVDIEGTPRDTAAPTPGAYAP